MKLKSINTSTVDGTEYVVIAYIDDDGHPCTSLRPSDEMTDKAVFAFVNGQMDMDDLIKTLVQPSDIVDKCAKTINAKLERISEHLSCDGCHVYFDNESFSNLALDPALEDHLVRCINDGDDEDVKSWANFAERLYGNTDATIRSQIVSWLDAQGWLTIDTKGRLVGYRGCKADDNGTMTPFSVHSGSAIVDGTPINGHIPNRIGSIIEMPRNAVQNDPTVGCSSGLHVGTFDYACGWAPNDGWLLRVAVAPEDIVSVPFECSSSKIRCCRFEVLDATPAREVPEIANSYRSSLTYDCDDYDEFNDCDDFEDEDDKAWEETIHGAAAGYHDFSYADIDDMVRALTYADTEAMVRALTNLYKDDDKALDRALAYLYKDDNEDVVRALTNVYKDDNEALVRALKNLYKDDNEALVRALKNVYKDDNEALVRALKNLYKDDDKSKDSITFDFGVFMTK